ncbi:hypothetical protein HY950_01045 [Candidatus Gottesmanbacteria bacterium]|nr:hypothetical protein [Candidatus Gottesmanbacteria bacterium]
MRKISVLLALLFLLALPIDASSQQAYRDYLYQFDVYRKDYSDFQTARGEYLKFQTLTSQTSALTKTKTMLAQRDMLLRTYLLLLTERLNENPGLTADEQNRYLSMLVTEINFLDRQKSAVLAIASLEGTTSHSKELETHYPALYAAMRGAASELLRGGVVAEVLDFDRLFDNAKTLGSGNRPLSSPEKQATIDRWIVVIANRRGVLEQTLEDVRLTDQKIFKTTVPDEADRWFTDSAKAIAAAKLQLSEVTANLTELIASMRYQD